MPQTLCSPRISFPIQSWGLQLLFANTVDEERRNDRLTNHSATPQRDWHPFSEQQHTISHHLLILAGLPAASSSAVWKELEKVSKAAEAWVLAVLKLKNSSQKRVWKEGAGCTGLALKRTVWKNSREEGRCWQPASTDSAQGSMAEALLSLTWGLWFKGLCLLESNWPISACRF